MGNKILLADDSITIQKVIELTFSDEDFEVVTVGNGRLAIERVQEVRPDVVLCDVIMPEKDGYEVCDFVKKSPGLSHIPVLLLTGAFEPFDQERAARVGCDGFLAKPFEPETLIARVKDLLAKAAQKSAAPAAPRPATAPVVLPPPPVPAAPASAAPFAPSMPSMAPSAFAPAPAPPAFAASSSEPEMAFIPDEPFEDLDAPAYPAAATVSSAAASDAVAAAGPTVIEEAIEELVPISAEESESLQGGPEGGGATVMFRADALPWSTAPVASPVAAVPPPPVPEAAPAPEPAVFEEVIEEDDGSSTIVMAVAPVFEPRPQPSVAPPPPPPPQAVSVPVPVVAPPPPPVVAPPPPPVFVPPPPPVVTAPPPPPPPLAPRLPEPEPPPLSVVAPAPESFADVTEAIEPEPVPGAPSVAAQVEVPVDMVSKIAERVVAQVSEKMVERIAWEVIPDLAEALIKRMSKSAPGPCEMTAKSSDNRPGWQPEFAATAQSNRRGAAHVFTARIDLVPRRVAKHIFQAPRRDRAERGRRDEGEKRLAIGPLAEDRERVRIVLATVEVRHLVAVDRAEQGDHLLELRREQLRLLGDHVIIHANGDHGFILVSGRLRSVLGSWRKRPANHRSDACEIARSIQPPPSTRSPS